MKAKTLSVFLIFFSVLIFNTGKAQTDSTYSILVAGHAYGAHAGTNIGLHPPLLKKLAENAYPLKTKIFFTGDIVNYSNPASWAQVAKETGELNLDSYYVMGNHDNNTAGRNVFQQKHGGLYYCISYGSELFIVLNSTESDRSISPAQLEFLENILTNTDSNWKRAFIFFHEIIWNSNEKYKLVRSNSRSRYDQMKDHSNFWNEAYPMLTALPEKEFFVIAGDVGGNPDAIAASYDKWENVTLISSGMGEVPDENYLEVDILPDTVEFSLIPLNDNTEMHPIQWYNVPDSPVDIEGPSEILASDVDLRYIVTPVFNATSYRWQLSEGMTGQSDTTSIFVSFDAGFQAGEISVSAVNDGFGESEPLFFQVKTDGLTENREIQNHSAFIVQQNQESFQIRINSNESTKARLKIFNQIGYLLLNDEFRIKPGSNSKTIKGSWQLKGFLIFELTIGNKRLVQKIIFY